MLLSLLLAILSYRWVELPFWKGILSRAEFSRVMAISMLVMAVLAALAFHAGRHLPNPEDFSDPSGRWRSDVPEIYGMSCDAWYFHARVEPCLFGSRAAPKTVVLLGDSIGAQWFSAVPAVFQQPEWRTVVLTKSACAIVDIEYFYSRIGRIYDMCTEWRNSVLNMLEQERPDVIIIASSSSYDFDERDWIDGSRRVMARLSRAANLVVVIPGTPALRFDGPGCIARNISPEGYIDRRACESEGSLDGPAMVREYLRDAVEEFPNVHILDLTERVCPDEYCSAKNNDSIAVFRDTQHLTDNFVQSSIPAIRERIQALLAIADD